VNHVEVTFKFLFSLFSIKCYQNTITHCVTTNGMNHPTGLYINRPIWQKTKPSKPYTSLIFKIIWNVTSDSRMNKKISVTYAEYICWFDTLILNSYTNIQSTYLKPNIFKKYMRTQTHTNANVYAVPTNMSSTQPTWSIKTHYYMKGVLLIKLLFP